MRNRLGSVIVTAGLLATSIMVSGHGSPALAQTVAAAGVYSGPAVPVGVSDHDSFSSWLNAQVPYAVEFLDKYGSWDQLASPSWALDNWSQWVTAQAGRRLVLSVPLLVSSSSGQLTQGSAGAFDGYFRSLAQNMVSRGLGTSVIRLGWEMNNNSFPWYAGSDPTAFRSFYARVVTVMRSVPGASFTFDWNPNSGVQGGSPLTTFDSFYPGDAYVDVIGLDVYDFKWGDSTATPAARWSWMMSQPLGLSQHRSFAAAHGKPVSFPEWGMYKAGDQMGGGGDSPYFVDAMADWFTSGAASYQSYFDEDWGGGALASFPNGQAEYKVRFGAPSGTTTTTAATSPTTVAPATTTTVTPATTVPPAGLMISNVRVSSVTTNQAVVTWTTSSPASSRVVYGPTSPTLSAAGSGGVTSHTVVLTNLSLRTRYAFQVQSDTGTASATSPVAYFTTTKR
jgi:hypothetical protein